MEVKRINEIDRFIKETQAELNDIEKKRSAALEKLRLLQKRKEQLADVASLADDDIPKVTNLSSKEKKIFLFRSLFKGRDDIFPKRYENTKSGKSGYTPNCENEWVNGICKKPDTKCIDCANRIFTAVSDTVIESHLKGYDINSYSKKDYSVGIYPILPDETCWFLAVDFDKKAWASDVLAFLDTCDKFDVPTALERSRSGDGAHGWIFFSDAIPASKARKLGTFLLWAAYCR